MFLCNNSWDALDGASLYELLSDSTIMLGPRMYFAARFLMCFWYYYEHAIKISYVSKGYPS